MFVRSLDDCREFTAGDGCLLRELLHPDKVDLAVRYSLAHATVQPDQTTQPHRLATSEVYYILEGYGEMFIDDESQWVEPGNVIYIPPGATQYIKNTGDHELEFLCIVDPAWRVEDEEILED